MTSLIFAGDYGARAAVAIDPVDQTFFTPESHEYPSGIHALKDSTRPLLIVQLNITGSCSPNGNNSQNFFDVSPPDSVFYRILNSGHMQVVEGLILEKIPCPKGKNTEEFTRELVQPPVVAWLRQALYKDDPSNYQKFLEWVDSHEPKDLAYEVKATKQSK